MIESVRNRQLSSPYRNEFLNGIIVEPEELDIEESRVDPCTLQTFNQSPINRDLILTSSPLSHLRLNETATTRMIKSPLSDCTEPGSSFSK